MTALLAERVYLSDVHLGDNANFLTSYRLDEPSGLYRMLQGLVRAGVVKLLLRNESIRPRGKVPSIQCESFLDVYNAWLLQDDPEAWITPPSGEERATFLRHVDGWVPGNAIQRYDYGVIKTGFMGRVRELSDSVARRLDPALRAAYAEVVARDWFSLSDFYALFQSNGIARTDPIMLQHGLVNENAYALGIEASLSSVDVFDVPLEEHFWPGAYQLPGRDIGGPASTEPMEVLLERASHVLDAPALAVLGLISAEEVVELRETAGRAYFELFDLANDPLYLSAQRRFADRFSAAAADYWAQIAEHITSRHDVPTHHPRRLYLLVGRIPESLARFSQRFFSFAVNVGVPVVSGLTGIAVPSPQSMSSISSGASLRFLFVAESEELHTIRSVIPDRTWLTRSSPHMFSES